MIALAPDRIEQIAEACVASMGDIFWDYIPDRDLSLGFYDPFQVAVSTVASTLHELSEIVEPTPPYGSTLGLKYREILARVGKGAEESELIAALAKDSELSPEAVGVILDLAKSFGAEILRNSLALAEAMSIENGETES